LQLGFRVSSISVAKNIPLLVEQRPVARSDSKGETAPTFEIRPRMIEAIISTKLTKKSRSDLGKYLKVSDQEVSARCSLHGAYPDTCCRRGRRKDRAR